MCCWFHICVSIRKKISSRKLVPTRPWIRNKVVSYLQWKTFRRTDRVAEFMMIKFGKSGHPVFQATSLFVSRNAQKRRRWKIIYTLLCRLGCGRNLFRTIISVDSAQFTEQFQICVKSMVALKTGRLVVAEQSDPHFAPADLWVTTPTFSIETLAQKNQLQKQKERVGKLSQPDQLIKICTDAGFLKTVEVGQYLMTKHTDEFKQLAALVTCREYTLPRDEKLSNPKSWIQGKHQNWTRIESHNQLPTR